ILEAINNGENLLVSAPRRVGKTSVLLDLVDNPDEDIFAVYINTEAMDEPVIYFQQILKNILNADKIESFGKFTKRAKDLLTEWANKISGLSIGGLGFELREGKRITFYEQLTELLSELKL